MERSTPGTPRASSTDVSGRGPVLIEKRAGQSRRLPLHAVVQILTDSWTVRLPVRAEHVRVTKQLMVSEEVVVRRDHIQDVVQAHETIRREEMTTGLDEQGQHRLTVEGTGIPRHVASTERLDVAPVRPRV